MTAVYVFLQPPVHPLYHSVTPTKTGWFSRVKSILKRPLKRKPVLLPPELWQAIFQYLSLRDVLNVRLTCKILAALAKAQAFSTYNSLPYMPDGDSLSRRVEWWTSESISPLVRQCSINSKSIWICHDDCSKMPARENLIDPIHNDFFQLLPRFVNIRRLHCHGIVFSDLVLAQICQLERLTTLEIDSCFMIPSVQPPMLKVTKFFFTTSAVCLRESGTRENRGWLEVLDPDHIRCIHIDIRIDKPSPYVADCSQEDLVFLYQHVTMIVSHPTDLRELVITGWDEDVCLTMSCISLPSLCVYDGPSRLFEVLRTGKDLRTLTLHGDPWAALRQLRPQSRSIERMELNVDTFSSTDVARIKRMFAVGIRIDHLGMHAIFSEPDIMYELNKACSVPGPGMKTMAYSYLYSPSRLL